MLLPHQSKQLVGRKVVAGLKKRTQDRVPLFGVFQAHALEMFKENILRFAHGFARRRGVVVNAGLEHGAKENEIEFHFRVMSSILPSPETLSTERRQTCPQASCYGEITVVPRVRMQISFLLGGCRILSTKGC